MSTAVGAVFKIGLARAVVGNWPRPGDFVRERHGRHPRPLPQAPRRSR
ncbi:MAG: hypothetical protein U0792_23265 [Gemmataceae bacterium]